MDRRQTALSKISKPKLTRIFQRPRLFQLLDHARSKPVTWISAPAGSGKTSLVASWLEERKMPCIWYRVDEGDVDIASFFYYMGLAARKAAPRYKRPPPLLTPEYGLGIPTFTRRFFENVCSRLKPPYYLVFDNYQTVVQDSMFHEIVTIGISTLPEGIRTIIISRADPPADFALLRANDGMEAIGWNELKLTLDESQGLMKLRGKTPLSRELVQQMHEMTQGWTAGIIFLSTGKFTGKIDSPAAAHHHFEDIFNYFAGVIFKKISKETREFLLKTAFFPQITPSIAESLTGNKESGRILHELGSHGYFTERIPDRGPTYQYHPLFREFLLAQARGTFTPPEILDIQRAGAQLLEHNGRIEHAAALYRDAGEWERLLNLIMKHAPTLVMQGRNRTVEDWMLGMPKAFAGRRPWILYWRGMCQAPFHPAAALPHFEKAFHQFESEHDMAGVYLCWSQIVYTIFLDWDSCTHLDGWIAELRKHLRRPPTSLPAEIDAQVTLQMFLALLFRRPQDPELSVWDRKLSAVQNRTGDLNLRMMIGYFRLLYSVWIGDFAQAGSIVHELRPVSRLSLVAPVTRIFRYVVESIYFWCTCDHDMASKVIRECLKEAEYSGIHLHDFKVMAQGVYNSITAGDVDEAERYLDHMASIVGNAGRIDIPQYFIGRALLAFLKGDRPMALEYARKASTTVLETGSPFPIAMIHVGLAQVLFDCDEHREAEVYVARAHTIGRQMKSAWIDHGCLLTESYFSFARGNEEQGLRYLKKALVLGKEKGYINAMCLLPSLITELCVKALEHGVETEYVTYLIRKRKLVPDTPPYRVEAWPWPLKIYTLGRFGLVRDGSPVHFSGKVQKKPLEMLKTLIALGGRAITEWQIVSMLWPDAEGDEGHMLFKTTLHRLRNLLVEEKALQFQEGRLSLDPRYCWVDVWAYERALGDALQTFEPGERSALSKHRGGTATRPTSQSKIDLLKKAVVMYRGHFLPEDGDKPWPVSLSERLRSKFLRSVALLGECLEQAGDLKEAIECYQKGLEVDCLAEVFYQKLIICNGKLGRRAEAIQVYDRCKKILMANLGIYPSPETETLKAGISPRE